MADWDDEELIDDIYEPTPTPLRITDTDTTNDDNDEHILKKAAKLFRNGVVTLFARETHDGLSTGLIPIGLLSFSSMQMLVFQGVLFEISKHPDHDNAVDFFMNGAATSTEWDTFLHVSVHNAGLALGVALVGSTVFTMFCRHQRTFRTWNQTYTRAANKHPNAARIGALTGVAYAVFAHLPSTLWQDVPPVWEHSKVFYQCIANDIPVSPAMVLFQVIHAPMAIFYGGTFGSFFGQVAGVLYSFTQKEDPNMRRRPGQPIGFH